MIRKTIFTLLMFFSWQLMAGLPELPAGFEQQIECPLEPTAVEVAPFIASLEQVPCQHYPLQYFSSEAEDAPQGLSERCFLFSRSVANNCSDQSGLRNTRDNFNCLQYHYNGERRGTELVFSEYERNRNHFDRASQLNETYLGIVNTQVQFSRNQNSYATLQFVSASRVDNHPLSDFSCQAMSQSQYREELFTCENEEANFQLHHLLDQLAVDRTPFEGRVRDILQVTMEEIEGGQREGFRGDDIDIQAWARDLTHLQTNTFSINFYLSTEHLNNGDLSLTSLLFRQDYGNNIQAMREDVEEIMNRRYQEYDISYNPGDRRDDFREHGFPTREAFNRQRDLFIDQLERRYRLLMTLRNVVEAAIIPREVSSQETTISSSQALRRQIQQDITAYGITPQELLNTGWFSRGEESGEIDFNSEFFEFLQGEISAAQDQGTLEEMKTISGIGDLWNRYQHGELINLARRCDDLKAAVNNLCTTIQENTLTMTAQAAKSCLDNPSEEIRLGTASRMEMAHQVCAGEAGFLLDGEATPTVSDIYHRTEIPNSVGGNPAPTGAGAGTPIPFTPLSRGGEADISPGTQGPSVPRNLSDYWGNLRDERIERVVEARTNQGTHIETAQTPLTDLVDQSMNIPMEETDTTNDNTGLFGNLAEFSENSEEENNMWDFLTQENIAAQEEAEAEALAEEQAAAGELAATEEENLGEEQANPILERINQLEQQLAEQRRRANAEPEENNQQVAQLQRELAEQRAELERMRRQRLAQEREDSREDVAALLNPNNTAPVNPNNGVERNSRASSRGDSTIAGRTDELAENNFNQGNERPLFDTNLNSNRIQGRGRTPSSETLQAGGDLASGSFSNSSASGIGITLTTRDIAEVNLIPNGRLVQSVRPEMLADLGPGEAFYARDEVRGIIVRYLKNEAGDIVVQEVRVRNLQNYLANDGELTPFESTQAKVGRVIHRLEAIEREAGIR